MNTAFYKMHTYKNNCIAFCVTKQMYFLSTSCNTLRILERENYSCFYELLSLILEVREKKIPERVYYTSPILHEMWYQT